MSKKDENNKIFPLVIFQSSWDNHNDFVRALQINRSNRKLYIYKIHYKGLDHSITETEKSQNLLSSSGTWQYNSVQVKDLRARGV